MLVRSRGYPSSLTHVLNLLLTPISGPQIRPQRAIEELKQHLEANLGQPRIIPPLAKLVPDKRVLSPARLEEAEAHPRLMQSLADEIPALGRDMIILLPENHHQLAFDVGSSGQRIIALPFAEGMTVDVGREIADCGADAWIQGAAIGEVAAQTHACSSHAAIAGGKGEKEVDGEGGVFVVGREFLLNLPGIAGVSAGDVVGEGFWACELVVGGGSGDYEALARDLTGKTRDGASDWGLLGGCCDVGEKRAREYAGLTIKGTTRSARGACTV